MIDGLHSINGFTVMILLVMLLSMFLPLIIERNEDD